MAQKQGDAAQLQKEGEKRKAKSTVTWHGIECDGSVKKKYEGVSVQSFQAEEEWKDLLLWFPTKSRCPRDCRGQPN